MSTKTLDLSKLRLAILDVETSGLEPKHDFLLEVGILIANVDLEEIAIQNWVGDRDLIPLAKARADEKVLVMHTKNGLWDEMSKIGPRGSVRPEIEDFLAKHTHGPEHTYLCGSSIHFDRDFLIEQTDLDLRALFFRRVLDISTPKMFARMWCPSGATEPREDDAKPHRVIQDCRDSLAELRHYRDHVFRSAHAANMVAGMLGATAPGLAEGALNGMMAHWLVEHGANLGKNLGKKMARGECRATAPDGGSCKLPIGHKGECDVTGTRRAR